MKMKSRAEIDANWDEFGCPVCDFCHGPVGEGYYDMAGDIVCEECISEYLRENCWRYVE